MSNNRFKIDKGTKSWKIRNGTRLYLFNTKQIAERISCYIASFVGRCKDTEPTDKDYYGKAFVTDANEKWSEAEPIYIRPDNKITKDDLIIAK
ncbi:hypothetical protein MBAV_000537 [Candidatus Magnetobacterium bavaricum]|uniref:Uncharacterized protein n=1 Tax=Candidatus Magnetobacterium bavaricum TaxID=29290 RepID=A0A0F3GZB9_9BACT|nr:hypothetical protein MBAV_000537 [Candidatus Magnetobacterium bavaricum]